MKTRLFFSALYVLCNLAFVKVALADAGSGYCDGNTYQYNTYCESMNETSCEMNSNLCTWFRTDLPGPSQDSQEGYCDGKTFQYNTYCESMSETSCEMNSNLCDWFR